MDTSAAPMSMKPEWLTSLQDPLRAYALRNGEPDFDEILTLYPRLQGAPAFDAEVIDSSIERLHRTTAIETGHPLLDQAVVTGLAYIDATFQGDRSY